MFYQNNNIASALTSFRKAARQMPDRADPLHGMAACYDRLGRSDLARRYFEEALGVEPANKETLKAFALSLRNQGRTSEAEDLLRDFGEAAIPERTRSSPAAVSLPTRSQVAHDAPALSPTPAIRLERLSLGEVALITTRHARPASALRGDAEKAELRILNGVGRRGQAARMARYLSARGLATKLVGDVASRPALSVIRFAPHLRSRAAALAAVLPFPVRLERAPSRAELHLVLGANARDFDGQLLRASRS
jgi:tetratricopeptide (TPR) repeat protein